MSAHTVGSAAWYEEHPEAPTRAEAEADAAYARRHPAPYQPGPLTDAIATSEQRRLENQLLDEAWRDVEPPF